jgi:hypothetical protein
MPSTFSPWGLQVATIIPPRAVGRAQRAEGVAPEVVQGHGLGD